MIDFLAAQQEHEKAIASVIEMSPQIELSVSKIAKSLQAGGKVLWCGNGGSAADAQHMAAELMVRYVKNRAPLASIALTTDTSILTAHSNDFDFETVFSRQIQALAKPGDILMALSTSGNSKNIVLAVEQARSMGCLVIAMTGSASSHLSENADICFRINSHQTARIQEAHSFINHLICEGLDQIFH